MKLVVGLDLSLTSTGICFTDGSSAAIAGAAKLGDVRLLNIGGHISLAAAGCQIAVIEALANGSQRGNDLAEVHGVAKYVLMGENVPYALVNPMHLKLYATGKSTGPGTDKAGLAVAAYKRAGVEFATSDECDAWWLRAMGLDFLGEPLFELPAAQRKALAKVDWPVVG